MTDPVSKERKKLKEIERLRSLGKGPSTPRWVVVHGKVNYEKGGVVIDTVPQGCKPSYSFMPHAFVDPILIPLAFEMYLVITRRRERIHHSYKTVSKSPK